MDERGVFTDLLKDLAVCKANISDLIFFFQDL